MFQLICFVTIIIFSSIFNSLFVITSAYCFSRTKLCPYCLPGSHTCPDGVQIHYPFWFQNWENSSEVYCGYSDLEVKCREDDGRAVMNISDHLYYVPNIDYERRVIRLVDMDLDGQECPRLRRNISLESTPSLAYYNDENWYIFYNCSGYPPDKYVPYYQRIPCLDNYEYNSTVPLRSYALPTFNYVDDDIPLSANGTCEEMVQTPHNTPNYTKSAKYGFDLSWYGPTDCWKCEQSRGRCYYDHTSRVYQCRCYSGRTVDGLFCQYGLPTRLKVIIGVGSTGVGGLLLILLLIYKRKTFYTLYYSAVSRCKECFTKPTNVEEFLESYGVALQRYSYLEIKKMTNSFKDILGQGGYGSVFQGKLNRDGPLVAVKVLNESSGGSTGGQGVSLDTPKI